MPLRSEPPAVERARPLLGTRVAIRVEGVTEPLVHRIIDAAFAEVAAIHREMSFHEPESDVGRLNHEAFHRPIRVSTRTFAVLQLAQRIAEETEGSFDVTTAAELVTWGLLPTPMSCCRPDPQASWRDIELGAEGTVRFRRPLWIDLGGIAKGYAVDRAVECLIRSGVSRCCVNAGGDLRVTGATSERIWLRVSRQPTPERALLEVENGSLASSGEHSPDAMLTAHVDGIRRRPAAGGAFACVVAESCAVADALTKPVLALRERCGAALRRYGATAHLLHPNGDWHSFGAIS